MFQRVIAYWDTGYTACSLGDLKNTTILTVSGIVFGAQCCKDIVKCIDPVKINNWL